MLDHLPLVPIAFFAMPVAMLWIKRHYAAIEKGAISEDGRTRSAVLDELRKRMSALETERDDLRARVENLESIACAGGLEPSRSKRALSASTD